MKILRADPIDETKVNQNEMKGIWGSTKSDRNPQEYCANRNADKSFTD